MHDFLQHRWSQPRCECSSVQQISEHQGINNSSHRDLLHWKHGSDLIVIEFPVDFNCGDRRVRQNGWIRVQHERQTTDERGKTMARSWLFVISMDIVSICQAVDELKYWKIRENYLATEMIRDLLDKLPRSWAKKRLGSNLIVWKICLKYSLVVWVSNCNCKSDFEQFPNQDQTASTSAGPANKWKVLELTKTAKLRPSSHLHNVWITTEFVIAQFQLWSYGWRQFVHDRARFVNIVIFAFAFQWLNQPIETARLILTQAMQQHHIACHKCQCNGDARVSQNFKNVEIATIHRYFKCLEMTR